MLKSYQRVDSTDLAVREMQYRLEETLHPITSSEIIDGRLLEDLSLETTATDVPHGLGRAIRGYLPVKLSASATIFDDEASNTNKSEFVRLKASGTVTATVWVF